jgi:hypothetical protein
MRKDVMYVPALTDRASSMRGDVIYAAPRAPIFPASSYGSLRIAGLVVIDN